LLVALAALGQTTWLPWLLIPLFFYGFALLGQAAVLAGQGGMLQSLCAIPLMLLTHILYGVGFWRGLFTSLKPSEAKDKPTVTLEHVAL
jgi:hypothetical protein